MQRMNPPSRRSFLESALALSAGLFTVLAGVWPDWLEAFGVNPDHGNGTVEWAIPVALALVALASALIARRHWRIDAAKAF